MKKTNQTVDQEREKELEERLEAIEWSLGNIDAIDDRLVKAYSLKLKKMIEEEEKRQAEQEMGQEEPALPAGSGLIS